MLQVQHLRAGFGAASVLDDATFILNDGEHVGLVGPNGSGKSTLLRCLADALQPDAGTIVRAPASLRVGYLAQSSLDMRSGSLDDVLAEAQAELTLAAASLQKAAEALATAGNQATALASYETALSRFEALGGYAREQRANSVLAGLGLAHVARTAPVTALSGGQKTRLGLALLLLSEPDLLLLDEPTNHLDLEALDWLEGFVRTYPGTVLLVSHDRAFLDRTVTRILWLDPERRRIASYPGTYRDFAAARRHEAALQAAAWRQQQQYVALVQRDVARLKSGALAIERSTTPRQPGIRKLARKKARLGLARERKLERYLASDERVEKPRLRWPLNLDFGPSPPSGRAALTLDAVSFGYDGGPPLLRDVSLNVRFGQRVVLVGPNGAGKTTLLRLMAGYLEPRSGTVKRGASVRLGWVAQEREALVPSLSVLESVLRERPMSETDARAFLPFFHFDGEKALRRVGDCSLGERSLLQLALLMLRGCNLLLLDEPLNHLDIDSRERLEEALGAFEGTVVAAAHDRAFLRSFGRRVIEVSHGSAIWFEGSYAEYERRDPTPRLETDV